MDAAALKAELRRLASPDDAAFLQRFFKTGPGEYGEGDLFIGIRVPVLRGLAKETDRLPLRGVRTLLHSPIHEERMLALLILVHRFKNRKTSEEERDQIYRLYMDNTAYINNWDLVDLSAPCIVGPYLEKRPRTTLYERAKSALLWDRRIAMISTHYFIRNRDFTDALAIAQLLLNDPHDLMHKAVGWMLREIGKRDQAEEELFLQKHYRVMPRTALRYAIERFPEPLRLAYLRGTA